LLGTLSLVVLPFISVNAFKIGILLFVLYLLAILVLSYNENKNLKVALLSVPAALLQLWGYGVGFLSEKLR